jgi:hypothetical protein
MKKIKKWSKLLFIIGIIALVIGTLDPLEGAVIISCGSGLIALSTCLESDRYCRLFMAAFFSILLGVFFLFYLSSLGGFGGSSTLSWWWGVLILPYPLGWLMLLILLITRMVKRNKGRGVIKINGNL